jgi:hypothetical protein
MVFVVFVFAFLLFVAILKLEACLRRVVLEKAWDGRVEVVVR